MRASPLRVDGVTLRKHVQEDAVGAREEVLNAAGPQLEDVVALGDPLNLTQLFQPCPPLIKHDVAVIQAVADHLALGLDT